MISNQILQNTIDGLKSITRRDYSILDAESKIVVTTEPSNAGKYIPQVEAFINSQADSQEMQGAHYFKIYDEYLVEYVLSVTGGDDEAYKFGKLAAFQIKSLLVAYKERFDRDNFIKNLLLDNLLLVDIYTRAKKLHIKNNVSRVVYLIECNEKKDSSLPDILRNIFPDKARDFVTAVDEKNIILVKELTGVVYLIECNEKKDSSLPDILRNIFPDKARDFVTAVDEKNIILVKELTGEEEDEIEIHAKTIYDTLSAEAMSKVYVAVGAAVNDLKDVSNSYKEANMALEVGKIFNCDGKISYYSKLGIGRIIYQLPLSLCKLFIKEVLKDKKMDSFDEETLMTVNKFFENSLNVSETSRQLYIHRNTLVYRLDKLLKQTGLDLRQFDDAIIFKITIMVSQYMEYMEKQNNNRL